MSEPWTRTTCCSTLISFCFIYIFILYPFFLSQKPLWGVLFSYTATAIKCTNNLFKHSAKYAHSKPHSSRAIKNIICQTFRKYYHSKLHNSLFKSFSPPKATKYIAWYPQICLVILAVNVWFYFKQIVYFVYKPNIPNQWWNDQNWIFKFMQFQSFVLQPICSCNLLYCCFDVCVNIEGVVRKLSARNTQGQSRFFHNFLTLILLYKIASQPPILADCLCDI